MHFIECNSAGISLLEQHKRCVHVMGSLIVVEQEEIAFEESRRVTLLIITNYFQGKARLLEEEKVWKQSCEMCRSVLLLLLL